MNWEGYQIWKDTWNQTDECWLKLQNADKIFNHRFKTFTNFIDSLPRQKCRIIDKLSVLIMWNQACTNSLVKLKNYEQAVTTIKGCAYWTKEYPNNMSSFGHKKTNPENL